MVVNYRIAYLLSLGLNVYNMALLLNLHRRYKKRNGQYHKLADMAQYLVHMLEENNVELTEFDVIALSDLGVKFKVPDEE